MTVPEIISNILSILAIVFAGFSFWYTRKTSLYYQSEQERNDHVELSIDIEKNEKIEFSFKNISPRRIIYLEKFYYKNTDYSLHNKPIGVSDHTTITPDIHIEKNSEIIFFFSDDLGRRFKKICNFL